MYASIFPVEGLPVSVEPRPVLEIRLCYLGLHGCF